VIARFVAAALIALTLAGCGDPELWARYQAERGFWKARRLVQRIQINPSLARPVDYQEAIEGFAEIERRFPLREWASPERLRSRRARDVAATSGDAMIAVGRIEEARERFDRAGEVYREAARQLTAFPTMEVKALLAEAALADRTEDSTRAHQVYVEIARTAPVLDPAQGEPMDIAVEAPLRVARELRNRGADAVADSVLRAAEERMLAEAPRHHHTVTAWTLWLNVGRLRAARPGDLDPALDAVRRALAEASARATRARLITTLAEFCLSGGRPDSALVYTAWVTEEFTGEARAQAMALAARVWETVEVDSAIAVYGRYIDRYRNSDQPIMAARFRRAELLEIQGRWLEARAEFRGLATASATDEYSLRSYERIVLHHLRAGEKEMARIEASRTLEAMDHLLTTVQDDATLLRIRQLRAQVLLEVESWEKACGALQELWSHYPHLALGVQAGFRAAELAEYELKDRERARRLYEELATKSDHPADQAMARHQLERMRS
jgi:tetratricopeptide (TPR) repeat protein